MKVTGPKNPVFFDVNAAQKSIQSIINQPVRITVKKRGTNAVTDGKITATYENFFLFEYSQGNCAFKASFRYSDIYTGDVLIQAI